MARGHPDWQPWTAVLRFSETGGATPFEQKIDIPANTAEGSPTTQDITLVKGFVSHVWIRFPQGPVGLAGVQIWDSSDIPKQLWPGATSTWFTGDNEVIEFNTEYDVPLIDSEYKLQIKGYNSDDSYSHSVLIRIWVVVLPA